MRVLGGEAYSALVMGNDGFHFDSEGTAGTENISRERMQLQRSFTI